MVKRSVSVILTVRNDPDGAAVALDSLLAQRRPPCEIIIVDGGSTDGTLGVIRARMAVSPLVRLIEAPGANIARGRNVGIEAARGELIATTDCGCRAEPDWLANLVRPFEQDDRIEFVAGFYRIDPRSLLETVVGLATMRGQLAPVDPETFNPSARSVAYTKEVWHRAGGLPEGLDYAEDTLFDHKVRLLGVGWAFAQDAIVHWRPRGSLRSIARQFYRYGTGRGQCGIGAAEFQYNIRNATLLALSALGPMVLPAAAVVPAALFLYFYVWTFHRKARRIARHTKRWTAYPLCLIVMWVVMGSNTLGYLVGCRRRRTGAIAWHDRGEVRLAEA
jgi:glycosyltransferase involved in cell wall biosynthesis